MAIPPTSTITKDEWLNIARCASQRGFIAERDGDDDRGAREADWWANIILMLNI